MKSIQSFFKYFFKNTVSSPSKECQPKEEPLPLYPVGLNVVTKEQWGAQPAVMDLPNDPLLSIEGPVKNIFYNDTASLMCDNLKQCSELLKKIQWNHQDGGWPDITHNFMIGTEGTVYIGRGWAYHPDAIWEQLESDVIDIAFIGNFELLYPLQVMTDAAEKLIAHGIKLNKVQANYEVTWFRDPV